MIFSRVSLQMRVRGEARVREGEEEVSFIIHFDWTNMARLLVLNGVSSLVR